MRDRQKVMYMGKPRWETQTRREREQRTDKKKLTGYNSRKPGHVTRDCKAPHKLKPTTPSKEDKK